MDTVEPQAAADQVLSLGHGIGPWSCLMDLAMALGSGHAGVSEWRLSVTNGEGERRDFRWDRARQAIVMEPAGGG